MDPIDPELVRAVREGTYVVDPRAVAEAIVRRAQDRTDARRISDVLVARELDGGPGGVADDEPGAGADVA